MLAPGEPKDGGIVVLETGRVFGGDSIMAYVGEYAISGETLTAEVRAWSWNDAYEGHNVFGMPTPIDHKVIFQGARVSKGRFEGKIWPDGTPEIALKGEMVKICELP